MRSDLYEGKSHGGAPETRGVTDLALIIAEMDDAQVIARVRQDSRRIIEAMAVGRIERAITIAKQGRPYVAEADRRDLLV